MTAILPSIVFLRCLRSGRLFPDYHGSPGDLRYCGEGDIIHVAPEDVFDLVMGGMAEVYEYHRMAQ